MICNFMRETPSKKNKCLSYLEPLTCRPAKHSEGQSPITDSGDW